MARPDVATALRLVHRKHRRSVRLRRLAALGLTLAACSRATPPDTGIVSTWPAMNYGLARAERLSPPLASRVAAYAAIALYEAWAAFSDSLQTFAGQLNGLEPLPKPERGQRYDPAVVGVESQTTVLDDLYRTGFRSTHTAISELHDSLIGARRSQGVSDAVIQRSQEYGARIGRALLQWAAQDSFLATRGRKFEMPTGPQYWVPTATEAQYRSENLSPATDLVQFDNPTASVRPEDASERSLAVNRPKPLGKTLVPGIDPTKPVEPYWGTLRPFSLPTVDTCQADPPIPFSTAKGSPFYQQAIRVYDESRTLTDDHREAAYVWADNPGESGTPAGHWLAIVSRVSLARHLSPERAVEAYALVAIATADAFIACWHLKYQVNLIRPVTYIQRHIDPKWQTLIITPPFPEYASGHAIQSAAAAEVLTALLGDSTAFDDGTHVSLGHPVRHYPSFRAAAAEAAMSRLYGGIHYPMANENGARQGQCIGQRVMRTVHTRKQG